MVTPALVASSNVTPALVLSTKKARERGNSQINAVGDRLGQIRIGAELLPEADKDEGLNQLVGVAFHGVAVRCSVLKVPPVSQLSAGRAAPPCVVVQPPALRGDAQQLSSMYRRSSFSVLNFPADGQPTIQ